ncbi:MAG: dihydrofolate reductase family protein [Marmoricola sp.]
MATQYYTASSVDGFIATEQHSLDWLLSREVDEQGPQAYDGFIEYVGAIAMGATTYQWIGENHEGPWPYEQPTWVFTHRDLRAAAGSDIRFTQAPVAEAHAAMVEAAGGNNVWIVGGGDLAGQFADAGLLDEVWVQYAPVTLGGGAPLLPRRVELELTDLDRNGEMACARYRVVRAP